MTLEQLRSLCAVVDQGSFAAAADAVGLTQPALSMQLSRLEDEAGVSLFLKAGRRKVLGAEGLVVLGHARRILAEVKALEDELAALQGLGSGTLAIAASDTVLRHLLAESVADFSARWPGVHLHLWNRTSSEALDLVREARADLGVVSLPVSGHPGTQGLVLVPWRPFSWVAYAPGLAWSEAGPLTVKELARLPLVLLEAGTRLHELWNEVCLQQGLDRGRPLETGSIDVQLDLAARGLGVALVPDYAVGGRPGLVRPVPALGTGTLALVHRPRPPRAVSAFLSTFPLAPPPG